MTLSHDGSYFKFESDALLDINTDIIKHKADINPSKWN